MLFWLLLPIVILSVCFGIALAFVLMKLLYRKSPVERIVFKQHFGVW